MSRSRIATTSPTRAGGRSGSARVRGSTPTTGSQPRWATDLLTGEAEVRPGLVAVPVPGHTKGSVVFLLDDRWLFTGDSLAWSPERRDLTAFRDACWYSWSAQADSLERLAHGHRFAAVLPGHGARHVGDASDLHDRLVRLVARMRR